MKSLIPWKWGAKHVPVSHEEGYQEQGVYALQREMNKLFEDFFSGMAWPTPEMQFDGGLSQFTPKLDLKETDREIIVTVEVPGMSEKDLEVVISGNMLTLCGEKKEEKEENLKGYYRMERTYGSFQRSIPLPCEIESDRADAFFKHGVLKVLLPKCPKVQEDIKKISVKSL